LSDTTPHETPPTIPQPPVAPGPDEGWYEEPDELPPRRRARFLTPVTVVLMLILFAACGFVGGVLVQKNQGGSSSATVVGTGAASRFGAAAAGASGASGFAGRSGFASRLGSLFSGAGGAAGSGATVGTVTDVSGDKLFVTTAAGTTTEVITTPESKITKSETVGANAIHPGDSVVATGVTGSSGALTAASISDSGHASTTSSGTSSLFGGGTGAAASTSSGSAGLFGGSG
jgi:hypothetical protein